MPFNKTEQQKYRLVKEYDHFQIRFYPSATVATINSNAKTYRELASPGFRKLAGYIFGGNDANKNISMTAPVHMDINDSVSKMSFVMPSVYAKENLPQPNDPSVIIKNTPDEYLAVIKFGGYASDKKLKLYSEKLQNFLKEKNIIAIGNYIYFGYNPPYQFINRKNEIAVAIEWKESPGH
jgi:hypothetical protein